MKILKNISIITIISMLFLACGDDEMGLSFEELRNEDFDLAIVTDAEPYINVGFSISGSIKTITVSVTPEAGGEAVSSITLNNITSSSLNRLNIQVPFPTPDIAESGAYHITYSVNGNEIEGGYQMSVINNRAIPVTCEFSDPAEGQVAVRLRVPNGASLDGGTTIYLTGSFESENGGPGDWTGGGDGGGINTFTKLNDTCYEIFVTLTNGDEMKVTRGGWGNQRYTLSGSEYGNYQYTGGDVIELTAENWGDLPIISPVEIPSEAVKPGMLTILADINESPGSNSYFFVEKGANSTSSGFEAIAFDGENRLAAAVDKANTEYILVKDGEGGITEGTNTYGFSQSVIWDGVSNPISIDGTLQFGNTQEPPATLVITGAGVGDGWNGGGNAGHTFTNNGDGTYSLVIDIVGDQEYLILPGAGNWDNKFGKGDGDASSGFLQPGGGNLTTAGLSSGSYLIELDFSVGNGTYTLTAQ